jgi:hypothetical protein
MGSERNPNGELQVIFVASNDSEGINNMKEVIAQITVWKKHKTIEILIPKDWSVRQHHKEERHE